jgi:hypothetical protein
MSWTILHLPRANLTLPVISLLLWREDMYKMTYRIISIIITFVLVIGMYSTAKATPTAFSNQAQTSGTPRVYAYYYLWWSAQHWKNKLGSNYPYNASPLPLPATTDADGCNAVSKYAGNQLVDVPSKLVSQDEPGAIKRHSS